MVWEEVKMITVFLCGGKWWSIKMRWKYRLQESYSFLSMKYKAEIVRKSK